MHPNISYITRVVLSLLALSRGVLASPTNRRQSTCNGQSDFCNRSYGNISFVGAHDSYAVSSNNIAANQDYNVTQQLNDGVRLLQLQTHNSSGVIELCHTSCLLLDSGPLSSYLATVKTWMDSNPNDVVTLLIVNSDDFPPAAFASVYQSAGLSSLSYSPPSASTPVSQWPTLGSMISAGTRLVTFLDTGADFNTAPYIIDEFTNVWETAFDVTDPTFDCNVNRTHGDPTTEMYLINHFLDSASGLFGSDTPDKGQLNVTNAATGVGSVGLQASQCGAQYGRYPNFLLVDFYEAANGDVFKVAASLNGVPYNPTTPVPPLQTTSASSTSSTPNAAEHLQAPLILLFSGLIFGAWTILF